MSIRYVALSVSMRRTLTVGLFGLVATGIAITLLVGSALSSAAQRKVGSPPPALRVESIRFQSTSGAELSAWFGPPDNDGPVIILSHGAGGARDHLASRAQFLRDVGYGVLIYDAQAHGESTGEHITFGYLEARDARAAVDFVAERYPESSIGFVGPSLAGASALLGTNRLPIDALVLEAVYPTLEEAVFNRVASISGRPIAGLLTHLLLVQVKPRLGFDPYKLNPIDRIPEVATPILLIAGSEDPFTTLEESQALYDAARAPKELWIVDGAAHESFYAFAKSDYETRLKDFFERNLSKPRRITTP